MPGMTDAAQRATTRTRDLGTVVSRRQLADHGADSRYIRAQCAADRWQVRGVAIVLHNGKLDRREQWLAARLNCGPRAWLTAFTALEALALRGWSRNSIHVLMPKSAAAPRRCGLAITVHRTRRWLEAEAAGAVRADADAAASPPRGAARGCG